MCLCTPEFLKWFSCGHCPFKGVTVADDSFEKFILNFSNLSIAVLLNFLYSKPSFFYLVRLLLQVFFDPKAILYITKHDWVRLRVEHWSSDRILTERQNMLVFLKWFSERQPLGSVVSKTAHTHLGRGQSAWRTQTAYFYSPLTVTASSHGWQFWKVELKFFQFVYWFRHFFFFFFTFEAILPFFFFQCIASLWRFPTLVDYYFQQFSFDLKAIAKVDFIHGDWVYLIVCTALISVGWKLWFGVSPF